MPTSEIYDRYKTGEIYDGKRAVWVPQPRQEEFMRRTEDEVLFGGAAGGGKSYGQLVDALRYAIRYPRSKQLILRRTYASYGFAALDTPAIEDARILLAKGGGETEKQIYRFQKGDSDLALRFDLTVPLAKYVALHYNDLAFPFRRYQISKVYRGERAQRGRFREFYQADIDIIGDGKLDVLNEAEIPAIIYQVFRGFGLTRFQIRVNNRKILNGFYAMLGLSERSGDIMRTVDKLDKIGADNVRKILVEDLNLSEEQADQIMASIGQSDNMFTPIQLAVYTGALATKGTRYKSTFLSRVVSPDYETLVVEKEPTIASVLEISDDAYHAYSEGMRLVTSTPEGTAWETFAGYSIPVAGKTGTAEHGNGGSENGSFPSRHIACAVAISMAFFPLSLPIAIFLHFLAILIVSSLGSSSSILM